MDLDGEVERGISRAKFNLKDSLVPILWLTTALKAFEKFSVVRAATFLNRRDRILYCLLCPVNLMQRILKQCKLETQKCFLVYDSEIRALEHDLQVKIVSR